ncbi:hypothetical protein MTR_5g008770 [Medicago truncatula]|uniref:Uncharacterized protein n=1 Tax=Medicago truncatula TaxID=3880 RepID=G7K976_MEDTR|nr:hypothetical protein MTR_5g008770 [Medicago truncatula]
MVEDVKIVSWNWLRFKTKSLDYSMSHWCLNPRACLAFGAFYRRRQVGASLMKLL